MTRTYHNVKRLDIPAQNYAMKLIRAKSVFLLRDHRTFKEILYSIIMEILEATNHSSLIIKTGSKISPTLIAANRT